jgi:hypothetical protein
MAITKFRKRICNLIADNRKNHGVSYIAGGVALNYIINCSDKIQHLGFLAWAACGKDPGFSPLMIINEAARSSHYSQQEYDMLEFENNQSDNLSMLLKKWKVILNEAKKIIFQLPVEQIGKCVMNRNSTLFNLGGDFNITQSKLSFHDGSLQGSYPVILSE